MPLSVVSEQPALFELPQHVVTFADFWEGWPNKVDHGPAKAEWDRAMRAGIDPAEIIAGRDHYKANKPGFQSWMHGRTFLHVKSRRWTNRYENAADAIDAALEEAFK